jgi:hypothetical protein
MKLTDEIVDGWLGNLPEMSEINRDSDLPIKMRVVIGSILMVAEAALKERKVLRQALEAVEWIDGELFEYCPWCHRESPRLEPDQNDEMYDFYPQSYDEDFENWKEHHPRMGHAPDCPRQIALGLQDAPA